MIETSIPGLNSQEILERVERRAQEYKNGKLASASSPGRDCFPIKNRYHFADFANYDDEEFIYHAYQAILRRPPDDSGSSHYLRRLHSGELSKESILLRLALSPEGRNIGVKISGLWRQAAVEFCYRLPLIGRLVHALSVLFTLPQTLRCFRAELRQLASSHEESNRTVNELVDDLQIALEHKVETARVSDLENHISAAVADREQVQKKLVELRRMVIDQQRRLFLLLAEAKKRLGQPEGEQQSATMDDQEPHLLAAYYAMFEDRFRGTREEIQARQQIYLPYVESIPDSTGKTILDLGCGRGEWLELLRQKGWQASGVDSNPVIVEHCHELGLSVIEADALSYLAKLPAASLTAVTALHLVEHLPFPQVVALLQECLRVLRPGGVIIVETPNPENLHVASCHFWYDPTHNHPLPPPLLTHIAEYCGILRHEIVKLHPFPQEFHLAGSDLAERFNEYFYGPQDYALIGYQS